MLILRKMVNGNFIPAEADVKNRDIEKILTGGDCPIQLLVLIRKTPQPTMMMERNL